MNIMDRETVVGRLVPSPQWLGVFGADNWIWTDERTFPTEEAIDAEYIVWQAEKTKEDTIATAHATYYAALEAGYTDTVGIVWYCNERATMDLAMMVVLNTLDETEPVMILSKSDGIRTMTYTAFKALAVEIGRYSYDLRQDLWTAILNA